MEEYAQNFGKGIESKDLVWFAKIEHSRSFDHTDRAVQLGEQQKGVTKTGDQTHIHVIVSRTENLRAYAEGKKNGLHERKNPYHLSPLTNHKATTRGVVLGGFGRNSFSQRAEQTFDQAFTYERSLTESFRFLHCMKYGDEQAKGEMQRQAAEQAAAADRQKRAQSHEQSQRLEMYQQPGKTPQNEFTDDLRASLSKAYQQKDVNDLGAALASAQAERERQRVAQEQKAEEARKQALEATKLAEQQKLAQQQKIEQKPENSPRISRGLGL